MNIISQWFAKNELYKTVTSLNIMRDFCYNYHSYKFLSSDSNSIHRGINNSLDIFNQSNDADICCNVVQELPQTIMHLCNQFIIDLDNYSQNSVYLFYPIDYLILFIENFNVTSSERITQLKKESEKLFNEYKDLYENHKSITNSLKKIVTEQCDFLVQQFPKYRSAKRGNLILRTISEIAGGFLGGYLLGSASYDLASCLDFGTLLGESCSTVVDTFTSGSRQDKISSYENFLNQSLSCVQTPIKDLANALDDIQSDCNDLMIELHNEIASYIVHYRLRRKEIKEINTAINYIHSFPHGISKYFKDISGNLQYIKQNGYATKKEYKQLLKLLS